MTLVNQASAAVDVERVAALGTPFRLAAWQVDPNLNQLQHSTLDLTRHLEPRLMKLLCFLAANQGQVLSRDELVAELWPRVIVNENSLTRAVSELRKQLATSADSARDAIQTIPKRGYRLNTPVQALPQSAPTTTPAQPVPEDLPVPALTAVASRRWLQPLGAGSAFLALCLGVVLLLPNGNTPASSRNLVAELRDELVMEHTNLQGAEVSLSSAWADSIQNGAIAAPVISSDGRYAFIKQDLSGSTIYLGELSSDRDPVAIFSGPFKLSRLTWSPVGNALLFARQGKMTAAALFSGAGSSADLFSLDLDTLQLTRLVEDSDTDAETAPQSNLTYIDDPQIPVEPA